MRYISGFWYSMLFLQEIMTCICSYFPQYMSSLQSVTLGTSSHGTEVHYGAHDFFLSLCNSFSIFVSY